MNSNTNTKVCISTHILVSISLVYVIQPIRIIVSIPSINTHIISLNVIIPKYKYKYNCM